MPMYYFDYEDHTRISVDDQGEEFCDADAAAWEALLALGDAARDYARSNLTGRVAIRVRDDKGPISEVSATFKISRVNK